MYLGGWDWFAPLPVGIHWERGNGDRGDGVTRGIGLTVGTVHVICDGIALIPMRTVPTVFLPSFLPLPPQFFLLHAVAVGEVDHQLQPNPLHPLLRIQQTTTDCYPNKMK